MARAATPRTGAGRRAGSGLWAGTGGAGWRVTMAMASGGSVLITCSASRVSVMVSRSAGRVIVLLAAVDVCRALLRFYRVSDLTSLPERFSIVCMVH
jgi:hypothetical protein